jgi:hypothetical protein
MRRDGKRACFRQWWWRIMSISIVLLVLALLVGVRAVDDLRAARRPEAGLQKPRRRSF